MCDIKASSQWANVNQTILEQHISLEKIAGFVLKHLYPWVLIDSAKAIDLVFQPLNPCVIGLPCPW